MGIRIGIGSLKIGQGSTGVDWSSYWATRWYGIEIDEANSSPDVTRIEGADATGYHATLPVHAKIKACLLNDDGTVNYYLDPTDWSKKADGTASDLTGADGQVMIEIPTYYRKVDNPSAGVYQIKLCEGPATGFTKVPKFYYSTYEGAVQRSTQKLASVVNTTTDYRGGNNDATHDADELTLLGKPATTITNTNFRLYARARGSVNWNVETWKHSMLVAELFMVEYATRNMQKAYDGTLTAEGYKKGGIGLGPTATSPEHSAFNGSKPCIPCGASNSLASGSGEVNYIIVGWPGGDKTVKVPRYRGIEFPFGQLLRWIDGMLLYHEADPGTSKLYIANNPNHFNDSDPTNYSYRGDMAKANGWITEMKFDDEAILIPKTTSATYGGDTRYCDYFFHYGTIAQSNSYGTMVKAGSISDYSGAGNGMFFAYAYEASGKTGGMIGARMIYITEW